MAYNNSLHEVEIDIQTLLLPIAGERPEGIDLRNSNEGQAVYYDLKELRHNLRRAEQDQVMSEEQEVKVNVNGWQSLVEQASGILTEKSKDVEVTCWLIEALVRLNGFPGLEAGFRLLSGLIEHYGLSLYPLPDEDGEDGRVSTIASLSGDYSPGTLVSPIYLVPLLANNEKAFTAWELKQVIESNTAKNDAENKNKFPDTVTAISKVSFEEFTQQQLYVNLAIEAVNQCYAIAEQVYPTVPSLRQLLDVLNECKKCVDTFQRAAFPETLATEEGVEGVNAEGGEAALANGFNAVGSENREVALNAIRAALTYYQTTEPHSPINYLLERVLRWSTASLNDILTEIVADPNAKQQASNILGILPPPPSPMMNNGMNNGAYPGMAPGAPGGYPGAENPYYAPPAAPNPYDAPMQQQNNMPMEPWMR